MACCGKKKRPQVRRVVEGQSALRNSLKYLTIFKNFKPKLLADKLLIDYHMKTHNLYKGNTNRHPVNKLFINAIVSYHNKFVKEMIKRNIKHITPLNTV